MATRKLTYEQAETIRREYATGRYTLEGLGGSFGISTKATFCIVNGLTYKDESKRKDSIADRIEALAASTNLAKAEMIDSIAVERSRVDLLTESVTALRRDHQEMHERIKAQNLTVLALRCRIDAEAKKPVDALKGPKPEPMALRFAAGAILFLGIVSLVIGLYVKYGGAV